MRGVVYGTASSSSSDLTTRKEKEVGGKMLKGKGKGEEGGDRGSDKAQEHCTQQRRFPPPSPGVL